MNTGIDTAIEQGISQLSLAGFTTLAPAGSFAFAIVALYVMFARMSDSERTRLDHFLVVPLAVALVGIVISTNHLGKPSNSLFVLTGVGRSPLSNEIWASLVFGGLGWFRWLIGFSARPLLTTEINPALLGMAIVAAAMQIWFTSNAYAMPTVISWDLPFTQVNQMLVAIVGGALLAACTLSAAGLGHRRRASMTLLAVALVAMLAAVATHLLQYATLGEVSSGLVQANTLVPFYPACIAFFAACSTVAIAVDLICLRRRNRLILGASIVACVLAFAGIMAVRFVFYSMHVTVGF